MSIDPTTTALVLIEYQNDSEGGILHDAVSGVMEQNGMLANTLAVVTGARAAGATVMHAPITFAAGYHELSSHPYGILKGVVDGKAFVKGSWGAQIVDELAPGEGDIVIEGKRGLRRRDVPGRTRERAQLRLPDVLAPDGRRRIPHRTAVAHRTSATERQ
jgi:ureidoacrylate peracid hydrolase